MDNEKKQVTYNSSITGETQVTFDIQQYMNNRAMFIGLMCNEDGYERICLAGTGALYPGRCDPWCSERVLSGKWFHDADGIVPGLRTGGQCGGIYYRGLSALEYRKRPCRDKGRRVLRSGVCRGGRNGGNGCRGSIRTDNGSVRFYRLSAGV